MRLSDHVVRCVTDEDYAKRMSWQEVIVGGDFLFSFSSSSVSSLLAPSVSDRYQTRSWWCYAVIRPGNDWLWCQTSCLCIIVVSLLFLFWEASVMEDLNPTNSYCCQWFNRSRATTWCDLGLESLWIKQRCVKNTNRLNCLCLSSSQVSSSCVPATNYELVSNCFFSLFFSFFFWCNCFHAVRAPPTLLAPSWWRLIPYKAGESAALTRLLLLQIMNLIIWARPERLITESSKQTETVLSSGVFFVLTLDPLVVGRRI